MKKILSVYFTAATSYNGDLQKNYLKILSVIKSYPIKLISGEQIVNKTLLLQDKKLSQRQIYERERRLIEQSDFILAEVTKPSLGVGAELSHALLKDKPVLALVYVGFEDKISPIIAGNPSENLFLEFYNFDKLPLIVRDFFNHIMNMRAKRGKIIVIEGGDGSGKTTQAKLLISYLRKRNLPTKYFDFPQYYSSFHGKTVAKFLRGEFGSLDQVSPYLISLSFALDRASVKEEMQSVLKKGEYIISNRYATANMAHQGAKFTLQKEKEEFLKWLYDLEYKVHKIPKEDIVIYLYVPSYIAMKLTQKKEDRKYLQGKSMDIQEDNPDYRLVTEQMYLYLSHKYKHWVKINCIKNGKILSPEVIHHKILDVLRKKKIIP